MIVMGASVADAGAAGVGVCVAAEGSCASVAEAANVGAGVVDGMAVVGTVTGATVAGNGASVAGNDGVATGIGATVAGIGGTDGATVPGAEIVGAIEGGIIIGGCVAGGTIGESDGAVVGTGGNGGMAMVAPEGPCVCGTAQQGGGGDGGAVGDA